MDRRKLSENNRDSMKDIKNIRNKTYKEAEFIYGQGRIIR